MPGFLRGGGPDPRALPLFPLHTVLFPGGLLPLRVFEQRYVAMVKRCLADDAPFGVCLISAGDEVLRRTPDAPPRAPTFASVGTFATVREWDMPQLGILHVRALGGTRFQVQSHAMQDDGLMVGEVVPLPPEPALPIAPEHGRLRELLELLARRVGPEHFPQPPAFDEATWVGYRLAELLPLPPTVRQSMLEMNDSGVRLAVLAQFLTQQGVL